MASPQEVTVGLTLIIPVVDQDGAVIDVSAATTKTIYLQDPNGVTTSHAASFTTDGSDGLIQYTTVTGDLPTPGNWSIQGYVILGTEKLPTAVSAFTVLSNIF